VKVIGNLACSNAMHDDILAMQERTNYEKKYIISTVARSA